MAHEIKFTQDAAKYLLSLDKNTRARILAKIGKISENPLLLGPSYPLKSSERRSSRVGSYRILFEVYKAEIVIAAIGPRGQIYRKT